MREINDFHSSNEDALRIVSDGKIGLLCYFWYFRMSIEVCFECLLRGLEYQVTILTVPNVALHNLSHTWRKPAL